MSAASTVLIIDDDDFLREANAHFLRAQGYEVLEAATGEQGVAQALASKPDIILLDVMLPDVSGVDVCVTLRRELVESESMIALASGVRNLPDDRSRALEVGADEFIPRPVGNRELLARVKALERIHDSRKALTVALKEREALMLSLHNRIKNDLYTVESLITLRESTIDNPAWATLLGDLRQRVHVIATVHETLYRSGGLNRVDARLYLADLVNSLAASGRFDTRRIELRADFEEVSLDANLAVVIGMALMELVGNALAHAFPDKAKGTVRIEFRKSGSDCVLRVEDDGVGFPPDYDESASSTLGLKLVTTLIGNLGGTIERSDGSGTRYRCVFKYE